jgi:GT2 family glycosyltransferase
MKPIDLHLVSWNRPKMTELVIKTIHRNTKRDNFRLVVLDNGSSPEQQAMLFNLHERGLIDELALLSRNFGLEAARQKMLLESTRSDYFVCVDNDCLPPPISKKTDWLEKLVDLVKQYDDFAAISCRTQVMIGTGNIFEEADQAGDDIVEFPHPGGSLRIMRTDAVKQVGGWDREARGRGGEERYICGKLNDVGYRTAFATKIKCLHLFGTRGSNGTDPWGYTQDMRPEGSGHNDISHPALTQGDNEKDVIRFAGDYLAGRYFG